MGKGKTQLNFFMPEQKGVLGLLMDENRFCFYGCPLELLHHLKSLGLKCVSFFFSVGTVQNRLDFSSGSFDGGPGCCPFWICPATLPCIHSHIFLMPSLLCLALWLPILKCRLFCRPSNPDTERFSFRQGCLLTKASAALPISLGLGHALCFCVGAAVASNVLWF